MTHHSHSRPQIYASWINRFIYPIFCVFIIWIIHKNVKKYSDKNANSSPHWVKIWSLLSLIFPLLNLLSSVIIKIPIICDYVYAIPYITFGLAVISFIMYQTVILQYVFVSSQSENSKFGYSHLLIKLLFAPSFMCMLMILSLTWFITKPHSIGEYGCDIYFISWHHSWILWIGTFITFLTHISVLILFVWKLYQLQNVIKQNIESYIQRKFTLILHKMLYLTVVYDSKLLIIGSVASIFSAIIPEHFHNLLIGIDSLISAMIVHLMIEHNNKTFIKLKNKFIDCISCHKNDCDEQIAAQIVSIKGISVINNEENIVNEKAESDQIIETTQTEETRSFSDFGASGINICWLATFVCIFICKLCIFVVVLYVLLLYV